MEGQIGLEKTPNEYVNKLVEVFREVARVLRPDGTLWLNLGDSYSSRSGAGPSLPGHNAKVRATQQGVQGGACSPPPGLKPKDLIGIPWRVAFALQADGWYLRSDIVWAKTSCMPESVRDRPTKEPGGGRNKRSWWHINPRPYKGAHFAVWPPELVEPMIRAGTSEKGCCPTCGAQWERLLRKEKVEPNATDTGNRKGLHSPTYSRHKQSIPGGQTLVSTKVVEERWVQTCGCPEHEPVHAVVLDLFSGSATTGMVALLEGRDYIGFDLNVSYLPMAIARIQGEPPPDEGLESRPTGGVFDLFGPEGD